IEGVAALGEGPTRAGVEFAEGKEIGGDILLGTGKRFSATESWFMREKPRSCFLAAKLTLRKRLPNWLAASQQIWRPRPDSSPATRMEGRCCMKKKRTVLMKSQSSVRRVRSARSQSCAPLGSSM